MSQPPMPYPPQPPMRRPLPVLRKKQVLALPIITIILGSLIMTIFMLLTVNAGKAIGVLAIILSATLSLLGVLLLVWLDRWEPEPPHLLVAAFFWGGGVSLVLVLILNAFLEPIGGSGDFFTAVIAAPLTEETAKGLFLVLILLTSRRGRAEFNSLTDALVYAGFIGIGFSFVEDMMYIAGQDSLGEALTLAGIRLGLGAFSHSIYTAMVAIALWKGLNSAGALRLLWPFLGWCAAVALHAIHNGSTFLGAGAYFGALVLVAFPAFVFLIVIGVRSSRREGTVVGQQLPAMVHAGWITPTEAGWLGNLRTRKEQLRSARAQGPEEKTRLKAFRDNVTELAFVRDRLDEQQRRRQPLSPELLAQHDELVHLVRSSHQWVQQRLEPHAGGWPMLPGSPGMVYGR